jgi:hypothetical protein
MSSWARTKYKTTNWSSYNDSLKQRGSLSIWVDPEMVWTPPPSGKRGRQCPFQIIIAPTKAANLSSFAGVRKRFEHTL